MQGKHFHYRIRQVLTDAQFNDNNVNCLAKDGQGMIWLGTPFGLRRFNGHQLDVIHLQADSANLEKERIICMEFQQGKLYLGTSGGVRVLDLETYQVSNIWQLPLDGKPVQNLVFHRGKLWWYTNEGWLVGWNGQEYTKLFLPQRPALKPFSLGVQRNQLILLDVEGFLYAVDTDSKKIEVRAHFKDEVNLRTLTKGENGALLICSGMALYQLDRYVRPVKLTQPSGLQVSSVLYTGLGTFTIYGSNKLIHRYAWNGVWQQDTLRVMPDQPIIINQLYFFHGRLMAATSQGLLIVDLSVSRFEPIYSTYNSSLDKYGVPRGITEDSRQYYMGTYTSLVSFNKLNHHLDTICPEPLAIRGMIRDDPYLWMASEGGGLISLHLLTRRVSHFFPDTMFRRHYFTTLIKMSRDTLLIGGYYRLYLFDLGRRVFFLPSIPWKGYDLAQAEVHDLKRMENGHILMSSHLGLFELDRTLQVVHAFPIRNKQGVMSCSVATVDYMGYIWAGTIDGLYVFRPDGSLYRSFSHETGLAGSRVVNIAEDRRKRMWVATFSGLSLVNPVTGQIRNFYEQDGLPKNEFNYTSLLTSADGRFVMGTVSGFFRFMPDQFELSEPLGQDTIRISRIVYGRRPGEEEFINPSANSIRRVNLGKDISYAKIFFYGDSSSFTGNASFEYKIQGIHSQWISLGNNPVLYLDNMKKGSFTVEVRSTTGAGSAGISMLSFPVVVQEYFYNATWFYVAVFSALGLMIIAYLRQEMLKRRTLAGLRHSIMEDMHDEIGGTLTGLVMNLDLLAIHKDKPDAYLHRARQLSQQAMRSLKDGLWALDNSSDTGEQLWDRLKGTTAAMLDPLSISYTFNEPADSVRGLRLNMLEKRNLLLMVKECITNAIKHGNGSGIQFHWGGKNGRHCISIVNQKAEYKKGTEGGLGLRNLKNRMAKINGTVEFNQENGMFRVDLFLNHRYD